MDRSFVLHGEEQIMRLKLKLCVPGIVVLASAFSVSASAQTHEHRGMLAPQPAPVQPVVPNSVPAGTGLNTSSHNEPGVPNTSTPGIIGTGASPSGLPGDSPTAPGFPGSVGRD